MTTNQYSKTELIEKFSSDDKIFFYVPFDYKEEVKKNGFRWSPEIKLWYIETKKITDEIHKFIMKAKYTRHCSNGWNFWYYIYPKTPKEITSIEEEIIQKNTKPTKPTNKNKYKDINF